MANMHALAGWLHVLQIVAKRAGASDDLQSILPAAWQSSVSTERAEVIEQWLIGNDSIPTDTPDQLLALFCTLAKAAHDDDYVPLRRLSINKETIFPRKALSEAAAAEQYQVLWSQLQTEIAEIATTDDSLTYLRSLQSVLQQYLWCMPANAPDVSLYDYGRVLASLLAVTADMGLTKIAGDQTVVRLVEGDLSGIQRFLYTIKSKGAARSLRARSFYLQALTQAAARSILREADLPDTNLLYAGGGRFYLLLSVDSEDTLSRSRSMLDDMLLTHHDGDLYLALGWTDITRDELAPNQLQNAWMRAGQKVSEDKRRRFGHLDNDILYERIFSPRSYPLDDEREIRYLERGEQTETDVEADSILSEFSHSLETFGRDLKRADTIVFAEVPAESDTTPSTFQAALRQLGYAVYLDQQRLPHIESVERAFMQGISAMPSAQQATEWSNKLNCPVARQFVSMVNVIANTPDGNTATFEDLQNAATGLKRLGVLRMDVDNLGLLFRKGFRDEDGSSRASLVRVAGLSFNLSLFFEGYVGALCEDLNRSSEEDVEAVYAVYSGGDDLFIVGRWDKLPGLAEDINLQLRAFACEHPDVHISGGITLHGGKYPLYQAAEDAESALDASKAVDNKNAMTFLGQTVAWQDWEDVTKLRDLLLEIVESPAVGRNVLQVVRQLHADYTKTRDDYFKSETYGTRTGEPQMVWGAWLWRSAYQLNRLADRADEAVTPKIHDLLDKLKSEDFQGITIAGIAARWVEALTKKESKGD